MAPKRYQRRAIVLLYRRCPRSMWPCWEEPDGDTFLWGILLGPPYDFPNQGPYWSTFDVVDDVWWDSPDDFDEYKRRDELLTAQHVRAQADAAEYSLQQRQRQQQQQHQQQQQQVQRHFQQQQQQQQQHIGQFRGPFPVGYPAGFPPSFPAGYPGPVQAHFQPYPGRVGGNGGGGGMMGLSMPVSVTVPMQMATPPIGGPPSAYFTQVYPYPSPSHYARQPPSTPGPGRSVYASSLPPHMQHYAGYPAFANYQPQPGLTPARHVTFADHVGPSGSSRSGSSTAGPSSGLATPTPSGQKSVSFAPSPPSSRRDGSGKSTAGSVNVPSSGDPAGPSPAHFLPPSHPHHPSHMPGVSWDGPKTGSIGSTTGTGRAESSPETEYLSDLSSARTGRQSRTTANNAGRGGRWTLRLLTDRDDATIDKVLCRIVVGVVPNRLSELEIHHMFETVPLPKKFSSPAETGATWVAAALEMMQQQGMADQFDIPTFVNWAISYADTAFKAGHGGLQADYTVPRV